MSCNHTMISWSIELKIVTKNITKYLAISLWFVYHDIFKYSSCLRVNPASSLGSILKDSYWLSIQVACFLLVFNFKGFILPKYSIYLE
jgi:hypothetical protein